MKIVRWIAVAALSLISLMDIGSVLSGSGDTVPVIVLATLLGLFGLVATYGLLRRRAWGASAAVTAAAVNVVSALIAMAVSSAGALAGLAVSLAALVLTAISAYPALARRPRTHAADLNR
ncbi:MAG TPA: hypothetical protein VGI64_00630 [Streptosporangiaceae bacterium]|jgi:hypothetical protein